MDKTTAAAILQRLRSGTSGVVWTDVCLLLEVALESAEPSPTTASHTKVSPSDAQERASTPAPTPLLPRVLGVLTDQELTVVDNDSELMALLEQFSSLLSMRALVASGRTWICQSPASSPSVELSAETDATSRSTPECTCTTANDPECPLHGYGEDKEDAP